MERLQERFWDGIFLVAFDVVKLKIYLGMLNVSCIQAPGWQLERKKVFRWT